MVTELSAPASTALPSVNSNLALNDRSAAWKTCTWQLSADPARDPAARRVTSTERYHLS